MEEKKQSFMEEQQAALKAKTEALSGKQLRLAGLLPATPLGGEPEVATPARIPLWPLLFLLPLLLIPFRSKSQPPLPPVSLNISLPQIVFPAKLILFYQNALREEAEQCQKLFQSKGIALKLEPLYGPFARDNALYLLEGATAKKWQEQDLLAPLPLQEGDLPLQSMIYPSLFGQLAAGEHAWALPVTVAIPFLFTAQLPWQRAGLGEKQLPTSWEEVLSLLTRLKQFDPDGRPVPVFWPFAESPLLWAHMLDRALGSESLKITTAWLAQLSYEQKISTTTPVKNPLMHVGKRAPQELEYHRALPPTPDGNPRSLLAAISYLALPKGSKLARKMPALYAAFSWQLSSSYLPPILGKASGMELEALARATPLFLDPLTQQELVYNLYKKLETNGKERARAAN